jgi:hypothetical protein
VVRKGDRYETFGFVAAHQPMFLARTMCRVFGVSRSYSSSTPAGNSRSSKQKTPALFRARGFRLKMAWR